MGWRAPRQLPFDGAVPGSGLSGLGLLWWPAPVVRLNVNGLELAGPDWRVQGS